MYKHHETDKSLALLKDKTIYIVGSLKLQNELMITFLELETGAHCKAIESFSDIYKEDNKAKGKPKLALWDFYGKDLDTFTTEFEMSYGMISPQDLIVIFNMREGEGIEEEIVTWGARGFFYEIDSLDIIKKGIQAIFAGELWISRKIMTKCIFKESNSQICFSKVDETTLTRRETEILAMIATGASNGTVAESLFISPHTVKTHLYNIYKKIDVPGRLQAALWASRNL